MTLMSVSKFVLSSFVALTTVFAFAAPNRNSEVDRMTTLVGDVAYGVTVHKVTGATAEEMVRNLAITERGDDDGFVVMAAPKDLDFGDQIGWGTVSSDGAREIYSWMDEKTDENGDPLPDRGEDLSNGDAALKGLADLGLEFGFTDASSSYCGVSFMGLLIVDVKNGVIYEIALTDGGPC